MRRLLVVALTVLVLAASGTAQAAPSRVIASAWVEGTYSLPGVLGYRSVLFTLYADGRLFAPGAEDSHGVWTFDVSRLDRRDAHRLREALAQAIHDVDFGDVPVADVGYTRVRVIAEGEVLQTRINALGMDTGLTDEQREARNRLERIIKRATGFAAVPYAAPTYEIRRATRGDSGIQLEWPGPDLPAGDCGTVPAATYAAFPDSYRQGGRYTWRGQQFDLWTRPLMPGQRACPG